MEDKLKNSIKYCMLKKQSGNTKQATQKIARALYKCDADPQSLEDAKTLLSILEG